MRMRMRKTFPIVTHHEPPKPHGFIFASVPRGFPARFVRMANRQGLLPPSLLSAR